MSEAALDVLSEPAADVSAPAPEAVAPAPTPAPAPSPEPDKAERPKDDAKVVGILENLRDEREKRQATQAELAALRERMGQFEQLKTELDEQRRAKQTQAEHEQFNQNPAEYLKTRVETLTKTLEEQGQQSQQAREQAEREMAFETHVRTQVQGFMSKQTDYLDALGYVRDGRAKEYEALGYTTDQIDSLFAQEGRNIAQVALQNNRNPAQVIYELAKARGYTPKGAQPAQAGAEAQLKRLEEGVKASQTLSGAGQPEEQSLLKKVSEMSDDEFDKFWKTEVQPKGRH